MKQRAGTKQPAGIKRQPFAIFRRIYLGVFFLIAVLGVLFAGITYLATTDFYEASTQLLNKDVATHIAKFTSPYGNGGFDRQRADSVFQDAMVISPSAEVYFLDTAGRVIYFHGLPSEIQRWQVPMEHIQRYISSGGHRHIDGPDPRDSTHAKIFSAAAVEQGSAKLGYIYVILGSRQYRSVTQMLYNSHVTPLVLGAFLFIIAFSGLVTLLYIRRIRARFDDMMNVLEKYREGDFTARFGLTDKNDLEPFTESFNKMADLLLDNIHRLTNSEKERKDFMVNISHDLRTPLAIARGYAETLFLKKRPLRPDEEREYGELVINKIRQVEKMVNQQFELSKMESASFEAQKEPFVFSEIVQEVIHVAANSPEGYQRPLDCLHCTDGSWVEADIPMLERVIQNLLVNAIKYSYEDGRIQISLVRVEEELIFRIENEGPVLASDLLQWLNGAGHKPATPAIGLTIVRKILLLHHFPFLAESLPGSLNAFSFRMPLWRQRPV
ncbi:MAG: HAMP domain-containing sensor histidine kinase [Puia sp.]|nr:HAMP domain-containing sensor histidine kinase [Puia sp.]